MEKIIKSELEPHIQKLIDDLVIKYGPIAIVLIGLFLIIVIITWDILKNKIRGEVKKGVDKHKAEIDNTYTKQIEHYRLYVAKQHKAYAKLNKYLLKTEGLAVFQALKTYPDFTEYTETEISKYLKERNASENELKQFISLMGDSKALQKEMQNYTELFNVRKARVFFHKTKNHYWINALYFSNKIEEQFKDITKILNEMIIIREIPSNDNKLTKEDMQTLRSLQKNLQSSIDKIVKQMKEELSAGLAK
ncbi:hypothetical protein GYA49_00240 [Candidatus Beckwithbacteria bacterium]|nr:hypothetical protein [Candidatus Beckwithbacteria bacterium]